MILLLVGVGFYVYYTGVRLLFFFLIIGLVAFELYTSYGNRMIVCFYKADLLTPLISEVTKQPSNQTSLFFF